jgi:hypothetical protein
LPEAHDLQRGKEFGVVVWAGGQNPFLNEKLFGLSAASVYFCRP